MAVAAALSRFRQLAPINMVVVGARVLRRHRPNPRSMTSPPTLPSDRQLLDAARRGDDAAWGELVHRHRDALAAAVGSGRTARRRADEVVAAARSTLLSEAMPPPGDPAIRAVRPALLAEHTQGFYGPRWPGVLAGDDERSVLASGDDELLAVAFATLPEPWQTALWHRHVDELDVDDIAPFVGRSAGDVDDLLATARRGLIDAFFREYERTGPFDADAAVIVPLLAGYHRRSLTPAEHELVVEHLRRDHIAIAPPVSAFSPPTGDPLDAPAPGDETGAGFHPPDPALAPPVLRRHDAVDSRRLLDLVSTLDRRLPAAIAPGVISMSAESRTDPVPAAAPARSDDDHGRRRWLAVAGAAVLVVGVIAAAVLVRNSLTNDESAPAGTVAPTDDPSSNGDDPVDDPVDENPVDDRGTTSPSTSLALRPEAQGPLNTISLQLDADAEPLGFAPAAADGVSVAVSAPAPVFAGGSGTIDLAIVNAGDVDRTVGLSFTLPSGIRFADSLGATCLDPDDALPQCTAEVAASGATTISVRFLLENSVVGRLQIDGDVLEPLVTPISVTQDIVHSSVGRGDVVVIGNTVTRCDAGAARALDIDCAAAADGTGDVVNRWDVPIEFVGAASQFGLFNSSSAELVIPEGADIVDAQLYWSGDLDERGATIPDDGRNTTIALGLPGGRVRTIEAGRVVLGDVDASQYLGSNDVTELVRSGGAGSYTVGNVHTVEVQGSYGAWALVVVYDHADEPRRQRLVTRPFEWVAPRDETGQRYEYGVDIPVTASDAASAQLDVFALEGELGFLPERLEVAGQELGGDNPFDSSIAGDREPDEINSLGVDIDTYDLVIDASDGLLPIRATSEQDGIRIAVLGLTVDLPT